MAQQTTKSVENPKSAKKRRRFSRRMLRSIIVVAIVLLIFLALYGISRLWLNYLWYKSLGQQGVFIGRIVSQTATMFACGFIAFVILWGSVRFIGHLARAEKKPLQMATWGALVLAIISGVGMSSNWITFRLAVAGSSFGITEPLFKMDAGFFVFTLPALSVLYNWLIGLLVLVTMLVLAALFIPQRYEMREALNQQRWDLKIAASVLAALYIVIGGVGGFLLALFSLDFSSKGLITGATYADAHVRVPVYITLVITGVLLAVILVLTARSHKIKLPVWSTIVWVALIVLGVNVAPRIVQAYVVAPNEATLERPYIASNIQMTRRAFALNSVETTQYAAYASISEKNREQAQQQLSDVCFWGDSTSAQTATQAFNQLQQIRPYYSLSPLMTDRYTIDKKGAQQQMLISSRLVNTSGLPRSMNNWINSHLVYTHGYGSAISSVSELSQGVLQFALGGVPPSASKEVTSTVMRGLAHAEHRLYFGPGMNNYIITNTKLDEFDYPKIGSTSATNRAKDITGVKSGGIIRRIAWAINYGSANFFFSGYLKPNSVVVDNRDIVSRAQAIAPWFSFSQNAFSTIVDGRTYWILDGYTSSTTFPYSQPLSSGTDQGKNYLRASVKVVVDATTGETKFYAVGDDPIRDAWAKIFPSVITPQSEIPPTLAEHFLYPKRAFDAQVQTYLTYHITNSMTFYDQEDLWQVSKDANGKKSTASYLMLGIANESGQLRIHMMQTFSPASTPNLSGLLTAGCDPGNYGKLTVFQLPKGHATLSAAQVSAQINQDPTIAPQIALWNKSGSNVIMGSMQILPVASSIVYVQPVFLKAQKNAVTQLARVIVVNGNKTAMGLDINDALNKLFAQ